MKEVLTEVRTEKIGNITLHNMDNMEFMRTVPDKYFDLAIVDPPYGINYSQRVTNKRAIDGWKVRKYADWDSAPPSKEYFDELERVSNNQIIWGGNHFGLRPTRCFLIWDKQQRIDQADCEMAWTSFDFPARVFLYARGNESGFAPKSSAIDKQFANIHPTQKPVALYKWLLKNYAKEGNKILDTHLGSGSIAIACHDYKFELTGCEIDKDYFEAAVKRLKNHVAQTTLF